LSSERGALNNLFVSAFSEGRNRGIMNTQFEIDRFDLVYTEKVHIANHQFGHNNHGEMDVWIEGSDKGERFLSQLSVQDLLFAVRKEIYSQKCYILRDKATGTYWFLDKNDCGFWLQNATFYGAQTFSGDESIRIENWLIAANKTSQ
jgi:hypothetical protein